MLLRKCENLALSINLLINKLTLDSSIRGFKILTKEEGQAKLAPLEI